MTDYAELLARHDYALVDRYPLWAEPWHDDLPLVPLVPEALRGDANILPALLDLKSLDATQTSRLAENLREVHAAQQGRERRVISSLLAVSPDTTAQKLQKHLESRFHMWSPQGTFLLRYYDPRAFIHFARVMDTPLLRAMYGPIRIWTIPFQNKWIALPAPEAGPTRLFWGVKAEQREKLDRIGYINMALKELCEYRDWIWRDVAEYTDAAEKADRALSIAAREFKFKIPDDLIAFAFHSFIYGTQFYRHPRVQQLLAEVQKDEQLGYAGAAITMVSEQEWAAIAAVN
jgi:hypothetical protein